MAIRLKCGKCGKALQTADGLAGKRVKCPGCGAVLMVPMPPVDAPLAEEVAAPRPAPVRQPNSRPTAETAPASKSKTGLIIALVAAILAVGLVVASKGVLLFLLIPLIPIVGAWKVFVKAGQPGWAVLVPIYNAYVMLKIAGKPGWWLVLLFVPLANLVVGILATLAIAAKFGKGGGFATGLFLLPFVFYPILGFGRAQYKGA